MNIEAYPWNGKASRRYGAVPDNIPSLNLKRNVKIKSFSKIDACPENNSLSSSSSEELSNNNNMSESEESNSEASVKSRSNNQAIMMNGWEISSTFSTSSRSSSEGSWMGLETSSNEDEDEEQPIFSQNVHVYGSRKTLRLANSTQQQNMIKQNGQKHGRGAIMIATHETGLEESDDNLTCPLPYWNSDQIQHGSSDNGNGSSTEHFNLLPYIAIEESKGVPEILEETELYPSENGTQLVGGFSSKYICNNVYLRTV